MGDRLRADHNYRLYSALVERMPQLKEQDWALKTINGIPDHQGWVKLGRESWLGIRCDLSLLEQFGTLDGQVLRVGQNLIQLGTLTGQSLQPSPDLQCRMVTIKSKFSCRVEPFEFGVVLGRQLNALGIQTMPTLKERKIVEIHTTKVVGFRVAFSGLKPQESLALQRHGVGGRRRMGCGYFVSHG